MALVLYKLGWAVGMQGDREQADALCWESVTLFRELGDKVGEAKAHNALGELALLQPDAMAARGRFEESLRLYRETGDKSGIATVLNNLGRVATVCGDGEQAGRLQRESLALRRELGERQGIAETLEDLSHTLLPSHESPPRPRSRNGAGVAAAQDLLLAARLLAAAERLRQAIGVALAPDRRPRHDCAVTLLRSQLGEERLAAAWADGRALPLEDAITCALAAGEQAPDPGARQRAPREVDALTAREHEVVGLVTRGLTNREIADALVISERTAEKHVANILDKLDLSSRSQLAVWGAEHGLRREAGNAERA